MIQLKLDGVVEGGDLLEPFLRSGAAPEADHVVGVGGHEPVLRGPQSIRGPTNPFKRGSACAAIVAAKDVGPLGPKDRET